MKDIVKIKYNRSIKKWQVVKVSSLSWKIFEDTLFTNKDRNLCRLFKQNLEIK